MLAAASVPVWRSTAKCSIHCPWLPICNVQNRNVRDIEEFFLCSSSDGLSSCLPQGWFWSTILRGCLRPSARGTYGSSGRGPDRRHRVSTELGGWRLIGQDIDSNHCSENSPPPVWLGIPTPLASRRSAQRLDHRLPPRFLGLTVRSVVAEGHPVSTIPATRSTTVTTDEFRLGRLHRYAVKGLGRVGPSHDAVPSTEVDRSSWCGNSRVGLLRVGASWMRLRQSPLPLECIRDLDHTSLLGKTSCTTPLGAAGVFPGTTEEIERRVRWRRLS
jgi:hypothetical protein